ncbi:MAG: hypothetical protein ACR65O_08135 [Methylomicrobium sp.]
MTKIIRLPSPGGKIVVIDSAWRSLSIDTPFSAMNAHYPNPLTRVSNGYT